MLEVLAFLPQADEREASLDTGAERGCTQVVVAARKEFEGKLPAEDKKDLEEALEQGRKAVKGNEPGEIESATEKITQASHKLAELMYKQQSQGEPGAQQEANTGQDGSGEAPEGESGGEDEGGKDGDDVIDAEFTEK